MAIREAISPDERRQFPRMRMKQRIACYVKGQLVEATSDDVSQGGIFLATESAASVPLNSLVTLVFHSESKAGGTTYLFGRVMRQQALPVKGLGLKWVKAVSRGTPAQLALFLRNLLDIDGEQLSRVYQDPKDENRSLFLFRALYGSETRPVLVTPRPSPVELVPKTQEEASEPSKPEEESGSARAARRPVGDMEGTLYVGERTFPLRVTRLGQDGMFVDTPYDPGGRNPPCTVALEIPGKDGPKTVKIACRIAGREVLDEEGTQVLDLLFNRSGKGGGSRGRGASLQDGLLGRYLKWTKARGTVS